MNGVVTKRTIVRVFFWPGAVLTVAVVVFLVAAFSAQKQIADAQVVNFYSSECVGGWDESPLASGEPQVTSHISADYTKENSAYLENKSSPITCGQFTGTLPPETYHTRVMVRFSWKQVTPPILPLPEVVPAAVSDGTGTSSGTTTDTSTDGVSETGDGGTSTASTSLPGVSVTEPDTVGTSTPVLPPDTTASTSFQGVSETGSTTATTSLTPEPASASVSEPALAPAAEPKVEPSTAPAPDLTPTPTPAPNTVSWWPHILPAYAQAEELVVTSAEMLSSATETAPPVPVMQGGVSATDSTTTTLTPEDVASSSFATSTTPDGAQFIVRYTVDGTLWHILGYVTSIDNDVRLEFPKEVLPTLDDISHIQISITPLIHIDTMQPVYLDAVWLEVSYAPLGELGVHGISDIVPTITPFSDLVSDTVTTSSGVASTTMTTVDFANHITAVHGIDERYVLVNVLTGTTSTEVWLFDMRDQLVHRIGRDKAQIGTMQAGSKDGMIFWLNAARDTIYTYDLRTAGSLHEMLLVGNLPTDSEYVLTFPFTSWQVNWRGDTFYFRTRKTGEVFQDENTDSARKFFNYFNLTQSLSYDQIQAIGGTFISEDEVNRSTTSTSTAEPATTTTSSSTTEASL